MRKLTALTIGMFLLFGSMAFAQEKLTADQVLQKHLESIAPANVRAAAQMRTAEGSVKADSLLNNGFHLAGPAAMFSAGRKTKTVWKFDARDYPGEQLVFDGSGIKVGLTGPGRRSLIGDYLYREDALLKEGLFGGVLYTSWPLLDLAGRKAQLKSDGLKKVDGHEAYELTYIPKKNMDSSVKLYFDATTFRHIKTEYLLHVDAPIGRGTVNERLNSRQTNHTDPVNYHIEEWFDDFKAVDGLTLPFKWRIRITIEPASTEIVEWVTTYDQVVTNPPGVTETQVFGR